MVGYQLWALMPGEGHQSLIKLVVRKLGARLAEIASHVEYISLGITDIHGFLLGGNGRKSIYKLLAGIQNPMAKYSLLALDATH